MRGLCGFGFAFAGGRCRAGSRTAFSSLRLCHLFRLRRKNRMGRDSNPRYLSVNTLSRRARSTTLPPIHRFDWAEIANFLCRIENGYSGEKSAISKLDLW